MLNSQYCVSTDSYTTQVRTFTLPFSLFIPGSLTSWQTQTDISSGCKRRQEGHSPPPPCPVKSNKKLTSYNPCPPPPPQPNFLYPLLHTNAKFQNLPGRWHNGSTFVLCLGDCPFESKPSPTSADAYGEVTGCAAGHQEIGTCSTRDGSQGMYITFTSTKKSIRQNPLWLWNPKEMSPEIQNWGTSGPQKRQVSAKNFFVKKKKKVQNLTLCCIYNK